MVQYSPERLRAVVLWLSGQTGKKQQEIGRELGYTDKTAFSAILGGHTSVPRHLPVALAALDPRINLDYLLGKSDEMLIGGPSSSSPDTMPGATISLLTDLLRSQQETIRSQQETIRLQQETILRGVQLQKKIDGSAG